MMNNMKKLMVVLLTVALLLTAVPVLAEEAVPEEIPAEETAAEAHAPCYSGPGMIYRIVKYTERKVLLNSRIVN